jgi:hypothetical protein
VERYIVKLNSLLLGGCYDPKALFGHLLGNDNCLTGSSGSK